MAFNIWPTPLSRSPNGEAHEANRLWFSNNIQHPCTVHLESIHSASIFLHFVIIIVIIIISYIYIMLFWVLKALLHGRRESPYSPPVCSIHLDDATAAILHQNVHHTPAYWFVSSANTVMWKFKVGSCLMM